MSLPSLPPRWKKLSPACFGRSLWSVAIELPVCREIMEMSLAEGIQMYSASHVEHQGCELRKASSSHGRSECRCISFVQSHQHCQAIVAETHSWLLLGCSWLGKIYALAPSDVTLQLSQTHAFPKRASRSLIRQVFKESLKLRLSLR